MSVKLRFLLVTVVLFFQSLSFGQPKQLIDLKQWVTKTGTPVFYVYERELPMVDVQVVFDAGSARDEHHPGLAKLTNLSLAAGSQRDNVNLNADEIAAAFDNVGALFSVAINRDMAVVALRSLSEPKFLIPAFKTFTEVLAHSSFPQNEFTRIKNQVLNILKQQEEQPASIAMKAFYNAVYDNAPYGHPTLGTSDSVSHLTTDDVKTFYQKNYTANNALIAIVGNIDQPTAANLADRISQQLPQGTKLPPINNSLLTQKSQFQHIVFPSAQTHVLIGQIGIKKNDPNYFPATVGNYVLGGGILTSRLFDEVRQKRGLAYTVQSQFNALRERGPFIIELQTRNSEAKNAISIVNTTLLDFVNKGPTLSELDLAKKNLSQGFVLRLANNAAIIAQVVNIGFYHLPLTYLDTYKENIDKVTNDQVKKLFQDLVRPNQLVTVTVGNNSKEATE